MSERDRAIWHAARNRRELIAAKLGRRDLIKLGLLTTTGYLVSKNGLSASDSGGNPQSPRTKPFVEALPIMPTTEPVTSLTPPPSVSPNTAINPANGLPFEGRTRDHQALTPASLEFYEIHQREVQAKVHPDLPLQTLWGFNGMVPGPTHMWKYGKPVLLRNHNDLPPPDQNGGFGIPSVTTHVHNAHTPSESDGFPCVLDHPQARGGYSRGASPICDNARRGPWLALPDRKAR